MAYKTDTYALRYLLNQHKAHGVFLTDFCGNTEPLDADKLIARVSDFFTKEKAANAITYGFQIPGCDTQFGFRFDREGHLNTGSLEWLAQLDA